MRNNDASEGTTDGTTEGTTEGTQVVQLWRSTGIRIDLVVAQPSKQTCGIPNIEWNVSVNVIKSSI